MTTTLRVSASRLKALIETWKAVAKSDDTAAKTCTALAIVFGDITESTLENQRGQALLQYLLDAKAPVANAGAVITPELTYFFHDEKAVLTEPPEGSDHRVRVLRRSPAAFAELQSFVTGKVVGVAQRELNRQEGVFAADFIAAVKGAASEESLIEAAPFMGQLLFQKDDAAMGCVEKAAGLCSAVFRRCARQLIEDQIVRSTPKTLYELRETLCERLEHPNSIHGLESLNEAEFSLAAGLTPCIFHQGSYTSQIQVDQPQLQERTQVPLRGDVVVVRYGTKNCGQTAFFARTLIVASKAPAGATEAYQFLYDVSEKTIETLTAGVVLRDAYAKVMEWAATSNPTLAPHLSKSLGFSTGLLVLETRGTISEKGIASVADGMCFVIRAVLERVPDGRDGFYDMELADTVVVRGGVAELKTKVARKPSDILYEDANQAEAFEPQSRDLSKITRQGVSDTVIMSREAQRDEELKKLLRELHSELLSAGGKKGAQSSTEEYHVYDIGRLALGEVQPFSPAEHLPPPECQKGIFVQVEKKVAWFPICGVATPFHISTISKTDVKAEGSRFTLCVSFHALQEANISYKLNRTKVFLKELNYASSKDVFTEVQIAIQGVQQRIKNEDAVRKRNATSAGSGKLIVVPNALRLPQIKMRPPIVVGRQNKGCVGNLELHQNGLRFSFLGGAPVDLLFDNVKHVIFQPAVNSISVIYHVTLKKPIELGRKSATEIQFVAEVMESSEAASGVRRSYEEEVNAEERDEARVRETNKQFITFARAVEEKSKIKTQLPTSKFAFDGVHTRAMTTFKGSREVLWAISDWPAFTQSVEEVEVVSFERVVPGGSTFDMSLIMKDYNKPVITVSSIPKAHFDILKDWCLAARLYYMESTVNPNWRVTMKEIRDDPEWDPWQPGAGWSVLNNEANDEEDEENTDTESDDSTYYEEEDEESSDSDDSSWLEDEESDVDSDSDDDGSSSVASWDELEKKAQEQDRKRHFSDDDEDRPQRRRRTEATSAPAPPLPPRPGKAPMAYGKSAVPPPRRF